jgi:predicted RNA-binding Zn-ribbon protein involved in translation (DUF1610 family)
MKDFSCPSCSAEIEELVDNDVRTWACPSCGKDMVPIWVKAPKLAVECIPSYPGCKDQKAGYTHTHGSHPATKVQSGYGGSQGPE